MSSEQEFNNLRPILATLAKGLSNHFGKNCEVVVHNITNGLENSIAIIENGDVTGRKVGDSASEPALQAKKGSEVEDHYGYIMNSKSGKTLKCSTFNLRNEEGKVIAIFGVNYDISDMILAERAIRGLLETEESSSSSGTIVDNVEDLLSQLIRESHRVVGKPVASMTKEDKMLALKYLDRKGAFLIKKSSERIAEYYCISKYTLYNYLGISSSRPLLADD
ncbi:MAG: helix-turn-helix transcriptional regulator [Coriobacteriia bacterium]|nr:helix-turn-helix transcriptional regulator [Coriobacteriia bacterium]